MARRKAAREAIHGPVAPLNLVLEQIPGIVWSTDRDLRFTSVFGTRTLELGLSPDRVMGRKVEEYFQIRGARSPLIAAHLGALRGDSVLVEHAWGNRVYHARISPLRAREGSVVGCCGIAQDLSEGPTAEDPAGTLGGPTPALHRAVQQALGHEQSRFVEHLEAKNAELERFTYTVSHDLKSPLITIQGFLGQVEQDVLAGDFGRVRDDIARVRHAAHKMQDLLDDLLKLSRIGRIVNPPEEVSLRAVAEEAASLVAGRINQRGVRLEISPHLPVVLGDGQRLLEVLENLIDNAVKYMGDQPEPRVEIGVRRECGETVCYVRDNGIGIDPRYQNKVFGLFEQLDQGSEGTGAGLALAERIVRAHGGRIWIESAGLGRGSTFCFTLPSRRGDAGRAERAT